MAKDWEYAKLTKEAHAYGGPEEYLKIIKEVASATARVMCDEEGVPETCAICGKKATHKVIFARAY